MLALLAIGTALVVVGAVVLADEWRRSGTQHARINKLGLRLEVVALSAALIGVGVAVAYVGAT